MYEKCECKVWKCFGKQIKKKRKKSVLISSHLILGLRLGLRSSPLGVRAVKPWVFTAAGR